MVVGQNINDKTVYKDTNEMDKQKQQIWCDAYGKGQLFVFYTDDMNKYLSKDNLKKNFQPVLQLISIT